MNELRDRLQELADGYARTVVPPGPAAARRRGRARRRTGLLFPHRPDNFSSGLIWEERPGLVVQAAGGGGVPDRLLREIAEGLEIRAGPPVTITAGPLPDGWVQAPGSTILQVLPRSHHQAYAKGGAGGRSS
jgi:hypothetical protein